MVGHCPELVWSENKLIPATETLGVLAAEAVCGTDNWDSTDSSVLTAGLTWVTFNWEESSKDAHPPLSAGKEAVCWGTD
ncbi:hypothetical protein GW17_00045059 [Ensete ventricosum]|uniref:Uncharacterized protein n=1 Tax=Ensete ventricosum TaxID=4639 RepID=A0A444D341_ENSVE|nr:hypothetical protein B296_00003687 [Ensete ventricosum]RWV92553.1 hypothetical protein GW17_00045059 [Ensete ventricosum]